MCVYASIIQLLKQSNTKEFIPVKNGNQCCRIACVCVAAVYTLTVVTVKLTETVAEEEKKGIAVGENLFVDTRDA